MKNEYIEAIVIGAGVVGLACARQLALAGKEVIIVDKNSSFGMETSSRNSEVIHAGIYYAAGSKKAAMCIDGRKKLIKFCDSFGVKYNTCGKLIVANSENQGSKLLEIKHRAISNGVENLELLDCSEVRSLEPELDCSIALLSPSTGIVDSHGFMLALLGDAEAHGVVFAPGTKITSIELSPNGHKVKIGNDSNVTFSAKIIVNSAGLEAIWLSQRFTNFPPNLIPKQYYAKGNYFSISGRNPFKRLIYPLPEAGGLGVHLTLDLAGQARFGPDVEWIDEINYNLSIDRKLNFYRAIRKYWPNLKDGMLNDGYVGIRPKIIGPDHADADFLIQGPETHGIAGLVNLFGIESPGLTASLSIAENVVKILEGNG